MARIQIPYKYSPRSYHRRIYAAWQRGVRHLLLVMHRRSGKTESIVSFVPQPMMQRKGNYAHVFPLLKQAKEVVWDGISRYGLRYLEHFPQPLLYRTPNNNDLKVTLSDPLDRALPGSTYQLYGTDRNLNALVGGNVVGFIWDEYALQNPLARDLARPIMAENDAWEVLAYTPRGENHGYDLYQYACTHAGWHVEYLTVNDTRRDAPGEAGGPVITEEAIAEHRAELQARGVQGVDALIEQEYYLSWTAPMPGAYWVDELLAAQRERRICPVPYDPTHRVYTAWDLGTSKAHDTNSIWFVQLVGYRVCVIDYHQASNKGAAYYAKMLDDKRYVYAKHFAKDTDLAEADWGTGKTRAEQLHALGYDFTAVPTWPLVDGINAVRALLPRCVFDDGQGVRPGLNGLRSYKREYDEVRKVFRDHEEHDWASHPAAGFRYLAAGLALEEVAQERRGMGRATQAAGVGFDPRRR